MKLFVGNVVDQSQKIGESVENFVVELASQFYKLHIDEIESTVGGFF